MCRNTRCPGRLHRGFTMVELLIALALLSLLSLITVTGMMVHARTAQSNLSQYQIAENARRFVDVVQVMALDATILRTNTGPAGADTVLTIGKPDPASPGSTIYKQYAYIDDDNNPATIRDNRLVERDVNTPMATTGKVVVQHCSPVPGKAIFALEPDTARPLYTINLRLGDRTSPPDPADNAITGRGYQSFLINAHISQL